MRQRLMHLATLGPLPRRWRMPSFLMLGAMAGMGLFLTYISRAPSYLVDNPETCVNCHVMATQYVTWQHSSHAQHATCNDCHVPHDNLLKEYAFKAKDGLWHATVFTMRWEPQAIRISEGAIPVVEQNCRRCHSVVVEDVALKVHHEGDQRCWDCHRDVPHGRERSLSATPDVFRPQLAPALVAPQDLRIKGRRAR
jgi:cytochrome c nitrite reductase small subunit